MPWLNWKEILLKISWHQCRILIRLIVIINLKKLPPEPSLEKHRKMKEWTHPIKKVDVIYYYIFRSGMIFKSKMQTLNHSIYTSIWKPNWSVDSMCFVNFCFLDPLTLWLGSKTSTGLYKMYCNSVERQKYYVLQYSSTFPLIFGVEVVKIQQGQKSKAWEAQVVGFFSFPSSIALFHKSNLQKSSYIKWGVLV